MCPAQPPSASFPSPNPTRELRSSPWPLGSARHLGGSLPPCGSGSQPLLCTAAAAPPHSQPDSAIAVAMCLHGLKCKGVPCSCHSWLLCLLPQWSSSKSASPFLLLTSSAHWQAPRGPRPSASSCLQGHYTSSSHLSLTTFSLLPPTPLWPYFLCHQGNRTATAHGHISLPTCHWTTESCP